MKSVYDIVLLYLRVYFRGTRHQTSCAPVCDCKFRRNKSNEKISTEPLNRQERDIFDHVHAYCVCGGAKRERKKTAYKITWQKHLQPGVDGRHAVVAQTLQVIHVPLDIWCVAVCNGALRLGVDG